jgi:hypothetical protein
MASNTQKVRDAYGRARQEQSKALVAVIRMAPAWEELSLPLREAIIDVYFAGRHDALEEQQGMTGAKGDGRWA